MAAAKTSVPLMVQNIIGRCMQLHGAGGLTGDYPMAEAFNYARWCRHPGLRSLAVIGSASLACP